MPTGSAYLVAELMPMEGEREAREVRENVEQYEIGYGVRELHDLLDKERLPYGNAGFGGGFLQSTVTGSGFYRELILEGPGLLCRVRATAHPRRREDRAPG